MEPAAAAQSAQRRPHVNPYVGLRPFMQEDGRLFFGRREQTIALLELLRQSRFLPVVGSSGSGKSSLVRAGLVPALCGGFLVHDRDQWSIATMKPGDAPLYNLAHALLEAARAGAEHANGGPDSAAVATLADALAADPFDAASGAISEQAGERKNLLLVVDQFEEIFAYRAGSDAERRAEADDFVALLLELAEDRSLPVYVVLTMRSDFAGDCDLFHGLPEAMNRTRYLVPRLRRDQLRQAIEGPALLEGVAFAPRLLDRLLNEMGDRPDQLPVLQHALQRTWEQRREQSAQHATPTLEQAHYDAAGTLDGALRLHADEALAVVDRKLAALLLKRLTDTDVQGRRVRRATSFGDLRELAAANGFNESQVEHALAAFEQDGRHFIHAAGAATRDARRVDISHESLIRQWPMLRAWVDEERAARDEFRALLARHERHERAGRSPATLLQEVDLAVAEQWLAQGDTSATWAQRYAVRGAYAAVVAYVQRSQEARIRAGRARKLTLIAVGVVLALSTAASTVLWIDARQGQQRALRAQALADDASSRAAALLAANLLEQGRDALQAGDPRAAASALARAYEYDAQSPETRLLLPHALALGVALEGPVLTSTAGKPINHARFSADGTRVVTASDDHTARIWEVPSGRPVATLAGHSDLVTDAVFSPAGDVILSASADGTARLWDARTGLSRATVLRDQASIVAIAFRGADALAITVDAEEQGGAVRIWTLANAGESAGKTAPTGVALAKFSGALSSAAFSPDRTLIVTVAGGTASIWNTRDGTLRHALLPPLREAGVRFAEFTADGEQVVALVEDVSTQGGHPDSPRTGAACVWNTATGDLDLVIAGPDKGFNGAMINADRTLWVTASDDHTARLWDATGEALSLLAGHEDQVLAARFSPDGELVATISRDKTARLWYARSGHLIAEMPGHTDTVTEATFSPDGAYLVTASHDGSARLWNLRGSRAAATLRGHEGDVKSASFSPDGARVVTASLDGTARVWNARTGGALARLRHESHVSAASFSPNGERIVTASSDATAAIWDAGSAKRLLRLAHDHAVFAASFNMQGTRVLTASVQGPARVWDAQSGQPLFALEPQAGSLKGAKWSPDGKRILTDSDGKISVWDAETGAVLARDLGEEVDAAAFSPDSQTLVTGAYEATKLWDAPGWTARAVSDDGGVTALAFDSKGTRLLAAKGGWARMLNARTAAHLVELKGHRGAIRSACFSPDGAWVVTASDDLTARVWEAATGRPLLTFEGHRAGINTLACSPDGKRLVTASEDFSARLWDISLETRSPQQIMNLVRKLPDAVQTAVPAADCCTKPN